MNPPDLRPRIWYFIPELKLGGTEKHVIRLARGLRERGYETGIVCVFQEGVLGPEVQREGIHLVSLGGGDDWGVRAIFRILNWFRSHPVDILHTYLFGFHLFAGLVAHLSKVPVILSSRRGRAVTHWAKKRHQWLENLGNFFTDAVTCCSEESKEWTLRHEAIRPEKVVTIHNGIDFTHFVSHSSPGRILEELGIPDKASVIGTIANFSPEKGYPYLLEAAERILKERSECWCVFVGSGPLYEEMMRRRDRIPGRERILFTGNRSDIPELLSAMDIFVLSSVIEGFPNVLLEAMAMARPVVATCVGGIPELIESDRDGVLVPPKDGFALSQAILSLLDDPRRRMELGERAQEKIKNQFTLDRMIDEYEALYLSLWRKKHGRLVEEKIPCVASQA